MKKTKHNRLQLDRNTLRVLTTTNLQSAVGGRSWICKSFPVGNFCGTSLETEGCVLTLECGITRDCGRD